MTYANQLWRLWELKNTSVSAAVATAVVSLVCIPSALTKVKGLDKFVTVAIGLTSAEVSRRTAYSAITLLDTDADLTYAERRITIQQHEKEILAPVNSQPMLTEANDGTIEDSVKYWLAQDKHLMVIGGSGAGKSHFIKKFTEQLPGWLVRVYDVDATVDDWKFANQVVTEVDEIAEAMNRDMEVIPDLRRIRKATGNSWKPERHMLTVADEFPALVDAFAHERKGKVKSTPERWSSKHARETRKLARFICIIAQDDSVENTGLSGSSKLRDSCFTRVYLGTAAADKAPQWKQQLMTKDYMLLDDQLARRPQ